MSRSLNVRTERRPIAGAFTIARWAKTSDAGKVYTMLAHAAGRFE